MYNKMVNVDYDYLLEIENKIKNKEIVSQEEIDYFLEFIVFVVRNKIYDEEHFYFEYRCDLAQSIISYYLEGIGVKYYPNITNKSISEMAVGHSFVVATFNVNGREVNYLIDPTYVQFFKKENCNDSNYIMINDFIVKTPDPGYFIKEEDRDRINEFNYYGFGLLDENLARIYGDSFYNTRTMETSKKFKSLKGDIYINSFLKGKEKLSKSLQELIDGNMVIDISEFRKKVK